jgi:hypothetical protein
MVWPLTTSASACRTKPHTHQQIKDKVIEPRLALLAVNSHGDEPFKPRLVWSPSTATSLRSSRT